ncbi:MAG TPA: Fe-S cluster assembly protein IscX [Anaerolineae bacterium]|nr:Fe-S cluster assembly protein IscX [Anaerolineae bacterium]
MELFWEDDYAIAKALMRAHPQIDPLDVELTILQQWITELPEFSDDKSLQAVYLLEEIQKEWYEEVASHGST